MGEFGDLTGVGTFLQLIWDEGHEIDYGTWGSALNGCRVAGKPAVADYFLQQMQQSNASINLVHYTLAMAAYAKQPLHRIRALARDAQKCCGDVDTYFLEAHLTSLLGSYMQTHKVNTTADVRRVVSAANSTHIAEALHIAKAAMARNMKLTRLTRRFYNVLLQAKRPRRK